jgi:hypothetical protein
LVFIFCLNCDGGLKPNSKLFSSLKHEVFIIF